MNVVHCAGCSARIVWLMTLNRKHMPINANFFTREQLEAPAPVFEYKVHQKGVHWADCPESERFRRSKR